MRYYLLRESSDTKEIGRYPQCDGWLAPYDPMGTNSIWKINYWESIDYPIVIPRFKLHRKSKWTDCLSSNAFKAGTALLASEKLKSLIEEFESIKFQSFATKVSKGESIFPYYFMYFPNINNDCIDYSRSYFLVSDMLSIEEGRAFSFSKASDVKLFYQNQDGSKILKHTSLYLKDDIRLPLIRLYGVFRGLFVSEELKKVMETQGITGIDFSPFDRINEKKKFNK